MAIQLLEIGTQTEQLAACRLALLMGVFTKDNRVAEFLKFSRSMLQADHAVLVFQNEPYIWFSSADGCKPFLASGQAQLEPYFEGADCIDHAHPNYSNFSQHIQNFFRRLKCNPVSYRYPVKSFVINFQTFKLIQ